MPGRPAASGRAFRGPREAENETPLRFGLPGGRKAVEEERDDAAEDREDFDGGGAEAEYRRAVRDLRNDKREDDEKKGQRPTEATVLVEGIHFLTFPLRNSPTRRSRSRVEIDDELATHERDAIRVLVHIGRSVDAAR